MSELRDVIRRYHERMHPDHLGYGVDTLPRELLAFRRRLHDEEVDEVTEAWDAVEMGPGAYEPDEALAHLLHELADVVIVAFGTSEYHGVSFDDVLNAVMRANMRKIPPKVPGGKATKPPGWVPADDVIIELIKATRRKQLGEQDLFGPAGGEQPHVRFGPVVAALFESLCNACDDEIDVGDPIRVGPTGAVHVECADDVNATVS